MIDFILFYIAIGLFFNVGVALYTYYSNVGKGYIVVPHPFIWFLTIFSWPKSLWDLIDGLGKKEEDEDEA